MTPATRKLPTRGTKGPLKAHLADTLLYRHWNAWKDGKEDHILAVDLNGKMRDLTPGPHESPVFSLGGDRMYDISPDGKWLVFASKRVADPAESTNADLFLQKLDENITTRFRPQPDRGQRGVGRRAPVLSGRQGNRLSQPAGSAVRVRSLPPCGRGSRHRSRRNC